MGRLAAVIPAFNEAGTIRDVAARTLTLEISEAEMTARRAAWTPPDLSGRAPRGYARLFADEITQADEGCDFRFMEGADHLPEPDIF